MSAKTKAKKMDQPRVGEAVAIGFPAPRPILVFTHNGAVIGVEIAPPGANDVRIFFVGGLGGFGCWTQNRVFMPNGGFILPFGTNDIHFSVNGRVIPQPGVGFLLPVPTTSTCIGMKMAISTDGGPRMATIWSRSDSRRWRRASSTVPSPRNDTQN